MDGMRSVQDDLVIAVTDMSYTWIILHVTEGLLSLVSIPSEETAIRAELRTKMASVNRLDMTVAPSAPAPPSPPPLTLCSPPAHRTPTPLKQPIRHNDEDYETLICIYVGDGGTL